MSRIFLDTNLLIYAHDPRDPSKRLAAIKAIEDTTRLRTAVVSTQVLSEFASVAIHKLHLSIDVVLKELLLYESLTVVQITPALIRRALELQLLHRLSFWDGQILAAAEEAGCRTIYSEDFSSEQLYGTVRIHNPFASPASA